MTIEREEIRYEIKEEYFLSEEETEAYITVESEGSDSFYYIAEEIVEDYRNNTNIIKIEIIENTEYYFIIKIIYYKEEEEVIEEIIGEIALLSFQNRVTRVTITLNKEVEEYEE